MLHNMLYFIIIARFEIAIAGFSARDLSFQANACKIKPIAVHKNALG